MSSLAGVDVAGPRLFDLGGIYSASRGGLWLRHDIETGHSRLIRLERRARETNVAPSDAQACLDNSKRLGVRPTC